MKKEKVLVDVKITCEPPNIPYFISKKSLEKVAEYYENWIKEFQNFIRDHRSQDPVYLNVEKKYKDICEFCEYEWEVDENGVPVCCQKAVDEFNSPLTK